MVRFERLLPVSLQKTKAIGSLPQQWKSLRIGLLVHAFIFNLCWLQGIVEWQ